MYVKMSLISVKIVKNKRPKEYIITELGRHHLEKNKAYWLD